MKALKYIFYAVGVLVLIAVIIGFAGPKTYNIKRTAFIDADVEKIWPYVSSAKRMQFWSPWVKKDTSMVIEYFGTDGTVGSGYRWDSKSLGKGEQTFTDIKPEKSIETALKISMPFGESASTTYIILQPTETATNVIWGMKGENDFMGKIFSTVFNLDKAIGKDYEEGLDHLKALMATVADTVMYRIDNGQYPGGNYFAVRRPVPTNEVVEFYDNNLQSLQTTLIDGGGSLFGQPVSMYYDWNTETNMADLAVGVGFKGEFKKIPEGTEIITLPPSKYLTTDYVGGYQGIRKAHLAMEAYIRDHNLAIVPPALEVYMTDGIEEFDTSKHLTKVIYFVK